MEIKGLNTDGFHMSCYKETGRSLGCQGRWYLRLQAHEYKAGRGNMFSCLLSVCMCEWTGPGLVTGSWLQATGRPHLYLIPSASPHTELHSQLELIFKILLLAPNTTPQPATTPIDTPLTSPSPISYSLFILPDLGYFTEMQEWPPKIKGY